MNDDAVQDVETTSEIAGVNLLNGLIKADAINVDAHVQGPAGGPYVVTGTSSLVNLVIDGNKIPINAAPNTQIAVGNLRDGHDQPAEEDREPRHRPCAGHPDPQEEPRPAAGAEIQVASATAQAH